MPSTHDLPRPGPHAFLPPGRPHTSLPGRSGGALRQRRNFSTSMMWRARAVVFALVICAALAGLAPTGRAAGTVVGSSMLAAAAATQAVTITFREATSAETSGRNGVVVATEIGVNRPVSTQYGDVMIATIFVRGGGTTPVVTAPGWMLIRRDDHTSGSVSSMLTYYRVAASGEPAYYIWSFDTARMAVAGICSYFGVNTSAPLTRTTGRPIRIAPSSRPLPSRPRLTAQWWSASSGYTKARRASRPPLA